MATGVGVFLPICWQAVVGAVVVWILVVAFWRYVSLASISAAAALPLLVYLLYAPRHAPPVAVSAGTSAGDGPGDRAPSRQHHPAAQRHRAARSLLRRATDALARTMKKIAILGAGSWGTALAIALGRSRSRTGSRSGSTAPTCWPRSASAAKTSVYLPGMRLPDEVEITREIGDRLWPERTSCWA